MFYLPLTDHLYYTYIVGIIITNHEWNICIPTYFYDHVYLKFLDTKSINRKVYGNRKMCIDHFIAKIINIIYYAIVLEHSMDCVSLT